MLDAKILIDDIDQVLGKYEKCRASTNIIGDKNGLLWGVEEMKKQEIITLLLSTLERVAPIGSVYRKRVEEAYKMFANHAKDGAIPYITGALKALRSDLMEGRLQTVTELIHADMFTDFLEMADYLQSENYKDAAAVIGGSVLEEHLRNLCDKQSITTLANGKQKKASVLNDELAGKGVYSKGDQKSVTAWLDLRNAAAHGHYNEYTQDQVALFLQSIRDFLRRYPA